MTLIAQSLGSGSSGNCLFIRAGSTSLLIDCGIGPRILAAGLRAHGAAPRGLSGILITHEHDDHVRGLESLQRLGVPIHCSAGTANALRLKEHQHTAVAPGATFACGEADITPIAVSHDAAEPIGFLIRLAGARICVVTDLGTPNDDVAAGVAVSDLIVLESNHDEHMLRSGRYPAHLKRRVASSSGHLSNHRAGAFLESALRSERRRRTIWLAHLSEANNRPELARATVASAFGRDADLHEIVPLPRRAPGPVWRPSPFERATQLDLLRLDAPAEERLSLSSTA